MPSRAHADNAGGKADAGEDGVMVKLKKSWKGQMRGGGEGEEGRDRSLLLSLEYFSPLHSGYQRGMKDVCRQGLDALKKRL